MADKFVFEKAMKRLEEIVSLLEKGDATLESSIMLFEEGTALIRGCSAALDNAQQKLKILTVGENGPEETDFEGKE